MSALNFNEAFAALTGTPPFPWQRELYEKWFRIGKFPSSCNLPTGLGKTSVVAIWLIALANHLDAVPRRLVYVVNRRTVVDQTTSEAEKIRENLPKLNSVLGSLALSTLRGQFADNREWSAVPSRPAVIVGTVDMIGSRLLFSGYGVGFKGKPLHAGFLGQDVLLVHDEAHLEPAFQKLLVAIEEEQKRCKEFAKFRVMELSATSRGGGGVFELTKEEREPPSSIPDPPTEPLHVVWRRLKAKKGIRFHPVPRSEVAEQIGMLARRWKLSGQAVLVFVRTIEDVKTVQRVLTDQREGVPSDQVQVLTGTLRGLERDRLATEDPIFARFLSEPKVTPKHGTVYLICTSAGEVGVDLSADHMVCDLTTLDSIAQRLGRVNRRGGGAAEIDVVYETDPDKKPKSPKFEKARWKTLEILKRLPKCAWIEGRQEGSPLALRDLMCAENEEDRKRKEDERLAAFAPPPTILPVSDILFDAWALTTIHGKLPGRPIVEPYLHGVSEYDPPQTAVAWREEVELLTPEILQQNKLEPEDLLEMYPLKPHEKLSGPTYGKNKVFEQLEQIADRDARRDPDKRLSAWVIDPDGSVTIFPMEKLVQKDKQKNPAVPLGGRTVVLPPHAGGLNVGLLQGDEPFVAMIAYDVSGEWFEDAARTLPRRVRVWNDDKQFAKKADGMRLIRRIDLAAPDGDEDAGGRSWHWFTRPNSADDDGSKTAKEPITWQHHTTDVENGAKKLADVLLKDHTDLHQGLILAARFHDLGKKRVVWQKSIGNPTPTDWHAKSGRGWKPLELTDYRHEFGSLLDILAKPEFMGLTDKPDVQELILHLIAVHHGYGRPHFPPDKAFDPEAQEQTTAKIAAEVPQRFARLQRKYGRWGLAYLESLLRAADWAASAKPSVVVEDEP